MQPRIPSPPVRLSFTNNYVMWVIPPSDHNIPSARRYFHDPSSDIVHVCSSITYSWLSLMMRWELERDNACEWSIRSQREPLDRVILGQFSKPGHQYPVQQSWLCADITSLALARAVNWDTGLTELTLNYCSAITRSLMIWHYTKSKRWITILWFCGVFWSCSIIVRSLENLQHFPNSIL